MNRVGRERQRLVGLLGDGCRGVKLITGLSSVPVTVTLTVWMVGAAMIVGDLDVVVSVRI